MQDNGYRDSDRFYETPDTEGKATGRNGAGEFYEVPAGQIRSEAPAGGQEESAERLRMVENSSAGEYVAPPPGTYEYYDPDGPFTSDGGLTFGDRAYKKAGFWTRFFAWLLDLLISGALAGVAVWIQKGAMGSAAQQPVFFNRTHREVLVLIVGAAYRILTDWLLGGTLGKRALRLKLISTDTGEAPTLWQVFFRETFGKYLSAAILGIGYLMVFFERGTLHDQLADTAVIYDL